MADTIARAGLTYRDAVDLLMQGRHEEARAVLEGIEGDDSGPERTLALAKARLRTGRAAAAVESLTRLLASPEPPVDAGSRAYWTLLLASALAADSRPEEALRLLPGVASLDPRLEPAANDLRRRLEMGRPPRIRL